MSIYQRVYYTLCNARKQLKEQYGYSSGLHKHHIIPKHSGGDDSVENLTYLTVREHVIAHFLLWKLHRNPLDLGAMRMLGANLTTAHRIEIGKWCFVNNIGIHSSDYKENKQLNSDRCRAAAKTQKELRIGTFSETGREQLASSGGKVGGKVHHKNKIGIHDPVNYKKNASLGGKAIKGMICVTNGTHRTRVRVEHLEEYLNNGYWKGFTLSSDT